MSTQVAIRKGNTAQTAAFTGVVAELTVDTDKKVVVVHDGTTAGGNPLIKANASITTGQILTSNGSHLLALSNTGTAGTYGNASFIPVVTTDAYGRVSSVTNTAIAISSGVVTGVMTFAQGGANATSYTTGGLLTSNGTSFVSVANTGTAGTYANAAYVPVITTDAYGRVSAVTNTAIAIDTSQLASGTLADARLPTKGTAGVYGNAAYHPVITTDAYGRVTGVTNTLVQISASQVTSGVLPFAQGGANNTTYTTGAILTSNGTAFVALANTGTAGTYANAAYIPVITTDAYGRVSSVTNTAVAIDTSQITSGTIADARLAATGTAGTYANAAYVPVITTDSKGRVTGITNTAIAITSTSVTGVMTFAQGGSNNTTYTTGAILTSNGTAFVALANTGTAGTYANAAYIPVITTDAYGRVSAVTNTAVAIDTSQITSGTLADARLPTKGTAGTYANAAYIPVITTDAYGRVTGVTNTAVAIDTSALTSGTVADARLPTKGTAGTYANSTYIPVITTDAYGRVTAITNTVIQSSTTSVQGIVQLTDSISSTSTTTAATPNSVKTAYDLAATKFNSSGGTVSGDTTITGNLIVNGTTTTVNTSTVSTSDSLLKLANNNTAGDSLDIGFYGTYNATGQKYAGLVRQAGSNFFLFKDLTTDPTTNTLATGSVTASNTATLRANITGGTVSSLASAIGVADGGTGATTLTAGGILIGSGTSAVTILANTGTAGTYGNAAYHPVITTDTYGRVSAVTNTAIAIDTAAITSGTIADARLPTKGTAGTYANAAYVPVLTTDAYGRVTAVTNTAIAIDTSALTSGTVADARLPTKGTAGTYANAAYIPVITTDAYGRVTAVTNTLVQISASQVTSGVLPFGQGGSNASTYTTGSLLTSNGTAFVSVSNTGTAGTYANAAYVPVITTDAYGRVSSVTNTAIAIDTGAITSGTIADARLPTKGTAGTYGNNAYHPVITTDAYGRVTAVTNTLVQIATTQITSGVLPFTQGGANAITYTTGTFLTSNGTAFVSVANTGTAGTYANASYVPVITTDAYGRVSAVTNTAIAIDTGAITSGTIADARLPTKGTAGTYGNTTYVPVITTDAYGRVTGVTNTAITFPSASGTVTSVALSVPTFLTITGSPVTTSGTLAVTLSGSALPITSGGTGGTTVATAQAALQVDPLGTAVALAIALG